MDEAEKTKRMKVLGNLMAEIGKHAVSGLGKHIEHMGNDMAEGKAKPVMAVEVDHVTPGSDEERGDEAMHSPMEEAAEGEDLGHVPGIHTDSEEPEEEQDNAAKLAAFMKRRSSKK